MNKYQKEVLKHYKEFKKSCEVEGCIASSNYRNVKKTYKKCEFTVSEMKYMRLVARKNREKIYGV